MFDKSLSGQQPSGGQEKKINLYLLTAVYSTITEIHCEQDELLRNKKGAEKHPPLLHSVHICMSQVFILLAGLAGYTEPQPNTVVAKESSPKRWPCFPFRVCVFDFILLTNMVAPFFTY